MHLPAAIQAFFDADQMPENAPPIGAFAPDASVKDEGETHIGHDAITAWWVSARARFHHTAEPIHAFQEAGVSTVRARVTGAFPASPVELTFAFELKNGKISSLEIGA